MNQPSTISRYRLTGELGRGGMGVVYRAEDPQLGRSVAVKVILFPNQASAEQRTQLERRFEREARAAAGIQHPGVITVYDFGRDGDYLYLVMELIEGQSLDQVLRQGRRPGRAAAFEIVARVADALAVAHAGGVVHRDVTPRNILIAKDGRVIVTDFGVARSLGEETIDLTHTGMLVGSPRYMAPELVRNRDFDGRADLFSLGVVLYFLLTGKQAFTGSDMTSLLYQIVHEDPLEDLDLRGVLGRDVLTFLAKSLAKQPEDRFQSAEEFAAQARRLSAESAGRPELEETVDLLASVRGGARDAAAKAPSRKPEAASKARPSRRPVARWIAATLLLLTLALGGAWAWTHRGQDGGPLIRPTLDRATASSESTTPEATPDALSQEPAGPLSAAQNGSGDAEGTEAASLQTPPDVVPANASAESETLAEPLSPAALEIPGAASASRTLPESPPPRLSAPPNSRSAAERQPPVEVAAEPEPADTVAPVLSLDPQPAQLTSSRISLSGRVLDDRGAVDLSIDGEAVPVGEGGEFLTRQTLQPGRNIFTFLAVDTAGNQSMRSLEVMVPVSGSTSDRLATSGTRSGPQPVPPPAAPAQRPPARFADRGDGSLLDRRTGLVWTKRLVDGLDWRGARKHCDDLELGRADDWMLPTLEELEEYYRAGTNPMPPLGATTAGPPPLNFPPQLVWSSSRQGFSDAWMFDLGAGLRRDAKRDTSASVFCVRRAAGQLPPPRREDGADPFGPPLDPLGQPGGRPDRGPPGAQGQQGPPGGGQGGGGQRRGGGGGGTRGGGGPGGPDGGGPPG